MSVIHYWVGNVIASQYMIPDSILTEVGCVFKVGRRQVLAPCGPYEEHVKEQFLHVKKCRLGMKEPFKISSVPMVVTLSLCCLVFYRLKDHMVLHEFDNVDNRFLLLPNNSLFIPYMNELTEGIYTCVILSEYAALSLNAWVTLGLHDAIENECSLGKYVTFTVFTFSAYTIMSPRVEKEKRKMI